MNRKGQHKLCFGRVDTTLVAGKTEVRERGWCTRVASKNKAELSGGGWKSGETVRR